MAFRVVENLRCHIY